MGYNSAMLRSVEGVPVILEPQILLHMNASQIDIFRSTFITYHILNEFKKNSNIYKNEKNNDFFNIQYNGQRTILDIMKNKKMKINNLNNINDMNHKNMNYSLYILPSIMGAEGLLSMIKNGQRFEKQYMNESLHLIKTSGWDVDKFTFGSIKTRVEW
jgi:hypothetical protein